MAQARAEVSAGGDALRRDLVRRIGVHGPLRLDVYIEAALFDPRWGYYATRDPLGTRGDFITAPEMSQVFGELIGLWCAEYWQRMGAPDPVILAELGPGRGTLMRDALRASRLVPGFARAARLHLVERSPVLRALQAEALGPAAPHWHEDASSLPPGPLLLIANEFLDALPIRQLVRAAEGWRERCVGLAEDGHGLEFTLAPEPSAAGALVPAALAEAPKGSLVEINPAACALARNLGARLGADRGAALFLDYGHDFSACGDTLQAVRGHRPHGVLDAPGEADLTAHVDFAAFAAAAGPARAWGPVAQGPFLRALGIEERTERLCAGASPGQAAALAGACRRLVDPLAMGRLFKALALTDRAGPPPAGFAGTAAP